MLGQPQLPPFNLSAPTVKKWPDISAGFASLGNWLRQFDLYLQGYLTKVYNAVNNPQLTAQPFANLAPASAALEGSFAAVNDSTTDVWGATITGGGANHVLAYCDGTQWTVMAK
jgi:hypothetical protein